MALGGGTIGLFLDSGYPATVVHPPHQRHELPMDYVSDSIVVYSMRYVQEKKPSSRSKDGYGFPHHKMIVCVVLGRKDLKKGGVG